MVFQNHLLTSVTLLLLLMPLSKALADDLQTQWLSTAPKAVCRLYDQEDKV